MATAEIPITERNLRHHLRVEATAPVTLSTSGGDTRTCELVNLSRQGLMIACDRETLEILIPRRQREALFAPLDPVCVSTTFPINLSTEGAVPLHAECHIVHTRRLARDRFHVGLHFESLSVVDRMRLEQFIAEHKPG
ncbi:PilZ domain-containing protein [Hahella sp. SMD15-11]|uniref:PilZ domain-containing protein n=1 Tax=Thermohahella caldifontis TaxID=3142973 RepID=A0AB39UX19_9GAMM